MLDFFNDHKLRRVINASGTETVHGASRCSPAVIAAVDAVLPSWVEIADLQRAAGAVISSVTGSEGGMVTGCSAAGIAVAVAAAMAGADRARAEQLPDTTGMKRRVILQKGHEVNFGAPLSQMIRLTGATVHEIGTATFCAPFLLSAALGDVVAAGVFVISLHTVQSGLIGLAEFCAICRDRAVPVIVDAAAEYDWRGIIAAGPTALVFSAQKAAAGPTAGIIAADADFAQACLMQERGIGRAMKSGKEGIAGAMAALVQWRDMDAAAVRLEEQSRLSLAQEELSSIPGLHLERQPDPPGNPFDRLMLHVEPDVAGFTAVQLADKLAAGEVKVVLRSLHADRGYLLLDTRRIDAEELALVIAKIRSIFSAHAPPRPAMAVTAVQS